MYTYNQLKQYRKIESSAASQLEQVAILLEHCAQLAGRAKIAAQKNSYEDRFINTEQMITILSNMRDAFNVEHSEHARRMISFLQLMIANLLEVNLKNNADLCEKIQATLIEMAQAWRLADLAEREQKIPPAVSEKKETTGDKAISLSA